VIISFYIVSPFSFSFFFLFCKSSAFVRDFSCLLFLSSWRHFGICCYRTVYGAKFDGLLYYIQNRGNFRGYHDSSFWSVTGIRTSISGRLRSSSCGESDPNLTEFSLEIGETVTCSKVDCSKYILPIRQHIRDAYGQTSSFRAKYFQFHLQDNATLIRGFPTESREPRISRVIAINFQIRLASQQSVMSEYAGVEIAQEVVMSCYLRELPSDRASTHGNTVDSSSLFVVVNRSSPS
jgi:hypothetical protein